VNECVSEWRTPRINTRMPELPEIALYAKQFNDLESAGVHFQLENGLPVFLHAISRGKELVLHCKEIHTTHAVGSSVLLHSPARSASVSS
jgi:hypothetical protein